MSYEYLKGMGGMGLTIPVEPSVSNTRPPASSTPATSPGTTGTTSGTTAGKIVTNIGVLGIKSTGGTTAMTAAKTEIKQVILAVKPFEPTPPSGCVRTDAAIRAQLRDWHSIYYSSDGKGALIANGTHDSKIKTDPNFTYIQAETLAKYLNAKDVVLAMLSGAGDTSLTVAQVETIKKWWWKCHKATYAMMLILRWRSNAMWMPKSIADYYKNYARSYGWTRDCPCPAAAKKTELFEFKTLNNKTILLGREATRRTKEAKDVAAVAQKTVQDVSAQAQQSNREAEQAREDAEVIKRDMQAQIDQLRQSLLGSVSADLVSGLQAQIQAMADQITAAEVRAQEAEAVAAQANTQAAIVEEAAEEVVAEVSAGLEPWYLQYKWYLLGGAVALAGGIYLFMSRRPKAVPAMAKNWLPEPTSPKRPSGLKGNPHFGGANEATKNEVLSATDAASDVLYMFEDVLYNDWRPHEALQAARLYVSGGMGIRELNEITDEVLDLREALRAHGGFSDDPDGHIERATLAIESAWAAVAAAGAPTMAESRRLAKLAKDYANEAKQPSGLKGNPAKHDWEPDEFGDGRPLGAHAPAIIRMLYVNMARNARDHGEEPETLIHWRRKGSEWSVGDNFDRYGHFVVKQLPNGKLRLTFRGEWGDVRVSREQALKQARRFFDEYGAANDFRFECYDPQWLNKN